MASTPVQTNEQAAEYVPGFGEDAFRAIAGDAPGLREARERAFLAYRRIRMPTRKDEEWRRTTPEMFPFEKARRLPELEAAACPEGPWDAAFDVVVAVTDGGFSIRDVSGALASGKVAVLPLAQAAAEQGEAAGRYLEGQARGVDTTKFEALADAFWNFGLFIRVPANVELERGILLRYDHAAERSVLVPKVVLVAEERSRIVLAEHLRSAETSSLMTIMAKEIYAAESARVGVITLQEWGAGTYHMANDWGLVGRNAKIDWITLNFGGKLCKTNFGSDTSGEGASAELSGVFFAKEEQHFDQRTLQVHSAPHTYSNLLYKGAVRDRARSVYQGLIIARPGANGVDAYQKNNNLVLNDGARADSLPGLEIDTDDLKCSHGSTIGNLDDEQVFYLRTRGLDEARARRVLINGFFEEIAQRVPFDFMREAAYRRIEEKLEEGEGEDQ